MKVILSITFKYFCLSLSVLVFDSIFLCIPSIYQNTTFSKACRNHIHSGIVEMWHIPPGYEQITSQVPPPGLVCNDNHYGLTYMCVLLLLPSLARSATYLTCGLRSLLLWPLR